MLTGEVKQRLIQVLSEMVERHRRARAAVTDEVSLLHSLCDANSPQVAGLKSVLIHNTPPSNHGCIIVITSFLFNVCDGYNNYRYDYAISFLSFVFFMKNQRLCYFLF